MDLEFYYFLVGNLLADVDPEGLAIRDSEDFVYDINAVLAGAYNYGFSVEDAAVMVLCSETEIPVDMPLGFC